MKARRFLSLEEVMAVENAVAEAEGKTAGEIVPVIATASGRYDRAEDIVGVLTALTAVAIFWTYFQGIRPAQGEWVAAQGLALGLLPVLGLFVLGFIAGSTAATYIPALKLPFIPKGEMQEEVEKSASAAFRRFRVRKTEGGVGVLIYLSLFEHRIRVLADVSIQDKIQPADWEKVRDLALEGIKNGQAGQGLAAAIAECGELLRGPFPVKPDDKNELSNELRFIE